MASLSLKNVCKVYPNGFEAVKDFNLEVEDQEFIIFVGPSGCGKTTVVCGLLKCLLNRKMNIHAFKCGPDYIDTSFHKKVLKIPTGNLDSWFCKPEDLRKIVSKKADKCDIAVIEGVMGYYDGMGFTQRASAYEIAGITSTPVILIINCKGMSSSLEALH